MARENLLQWTLDMQSRCLNYVLGYLDALAGNASSEDARESARTACDTIRTMLAVPAPDAPEVRQWMDGREQEQTNQEESWTRKS